METKEYGRNEWFAMGRYKKKWHLALLSAGILAALTLGAAAPRAVFAEDYDDEGGSCSLGAEGLDNGGYRAKHVAAGIEDDDAVNVGQLKSYQTEVKGDGAIEVTKTEAEDGHAIYTVKGGGGAEYTAGDNVTISEEHVISAKDTALESGDNGLTLSGKTLKLSVKDTAGNEVTGSADLSALADGNTTYTLTSENGDSGATLTLLGSDGNKQTVTVPEAEVKGDGAIEVTRTKADDGHAIYTVKGGAVYTAGDNVTISDDHVISAKDTRNTVAAGDYISVTEKKNDDGSLAYTVSAKAEGNVAEGDKGLVTGGTVYSETRSAADRNVIRKGNTAGENITALDKKNRRPGRRDFQYQQQRDKHGRVHQ